MGEREPKKETIGKGELYFLTHPGSEIIFSGYGLTIQSDRKGYLAGLLMVDRPKPAASEWLKQVEDIFGECRMVPMTYVDERGIICRMQVEPDSQVHLRQFHSIKSSAIKAALEPLMDQLPKPVFNMHWNEDENLWQSQIAYPNKLPKEVIVALMKFGYGCLALEANVGVIHVCHAADKDIESFANKPVISQWQLIKMPTAPLIRLELIILDQPDNPFRFESFLNVEDEDQANILAQLANQDRLYMAFYGDELNYRFTKVIPHSEQQWQQIDELTMEAKNHLSGIPPEQQDYDLAKTEFMSEHI